MITTDAGSCSVWPLSWRLAVFVTVRLEPHAWFCVYSSVPVPLTVFGRLASKLSVRLPLSSTRVGVAVDGSKLAEPVYVAAFDSVAVALFVPVFELVRVVV